MLLKLALIFFGYLVAVTVAAILTVALLFLPAVLSGGLAEAADAPPIMVVGFFWTFACALPGFIVAIALGERRGWSHWIVYATAGFLDVIPSFAIFGVLTGSLAGITELVLCAFAGGFIGGAAYWAAAGRFVAARRLSV